MVLMPVLAQGVQGSYSYSDIAIIGDDSASLAFGVMLSLGGHNVRLWLPQGNCPSECELHGPQVVPGVAGVRVAMRFSVVTKDVEKALQGASVIVVGSAANLYPRSLNVLLPYLSTGQTIVLIDAPLGASLQFAKDLRRVKAALEVNLLETSNLFDAVTATDGLLSIHRPRPRVSVCGVTRNATYRGLSVLGQMRDGLVPASNVLERGFADVERILRPILWLFRMISGRSDEVADQSLLLTPEVLAIIAGIGGELQSVARAFGVAIRPLGQILAEYSGDRNDSLGNVLAKWSTTNRMQMQLGECCPWKKQLAQDIEESLIPLVGFAMVARQPVPLIDSIIELAAVVCGKNLRKQGRNLTDLGLVGLDVEEIIELVNG
ncbi:MAG: NAD/NADP octopine/nopaline dehydrogenase family protein [Candidatus Melainabacteria bacterium]|nr:NAD/NADP octopine/nopaline dehydrogenase family protein [Candidatus Melainabacteria bacterium]